MKRGFYEEVHERVGRGWSRPVELPDYKDARVARGSGPQTLRTKDPAPPLLLLELAVPMEI